jgi:hypothetical protein
MASFVRIVVVRGPGVSKNGSSPTGFIFERGFMFSVFMATPGEKVSLLLDYNSLAHIAPDLHITQIDNTYIVYMYYRYFPWVPCSGKSD